MVTVDRRAATQSHPGSRQCPSHVQTTSDDLTLWQSRVEQRLYTEHKSFPNMWLGTKTRTSLFKFLVVKLVPGPPGRPPMEIDPELIRQSLEWTSGVAQSAAGSAVGDLLSQVLKRANIPKGEARKFEEGQASTSDINKIVDLLTYQMQHDSKLEVLLGQLVSNFYNTPKTINNGPGAGQQDSQNITNSPWSRNIFVSDGGRSAVPVNVQLDYYDEELSPGTHSEVRGTIWVEYAGTWEVDIFVAGPLEPFCHPNIQRLKVSSENAQMRQKQFKIVIDLAPHKPTAGRYDFTVVVQPVSRGGATRTTKSLRVKSVPILRLGSNKRPAVEHYIENVGNNSIAVNIAATGPKGSEIIVDHSSFRVSQYDSQAFSISVNKTPIRFWRRGALPVQLTTGAKGINYQSELEVPVEDSVRRRAVVRLCFRMIFFLIAFFLLWQLIQLIVANMSTILTAILWTSIGLIVLAGIGIFSKSDK